MTAAAVEEHQQQKVRKKNCTTKNGVVNFVNCFIIYLLFLGRVQNEQMNDEKTNGRDRLYVFMWEKERKRRALIAASVVIASWRAVATRVSWNLQSTSTHLTISHYLYSLFFLVFSFLHFSLWFFWIFLEFIMKYIRIKWFSSIFGYDVARKKNSSQMCSYAWH